MTDFDKLTEKEYRAYNLESYSSLKNLLDSPIKFMYYKNNPFKGSDSTLLGTCIHNYLQGNRHLVAFNTIKRTSKAAKEEYEKFVTEFRDLAGEEGIIVPVSFENTIINIMKNASENKKVQKLLQGVQIEAPVIAEFQGLKYKAKIDGLGDEYVLEIKSSSQATTVSEFHDECLERDYDLQAFMYCHATGRNHHYFIVCNTTAPFKVEAYKTSPTTLTSGYTKFCKIVEDYQHYIINNHPYDEGEHFDEV